MCYAPILKELKRVLPVTPENRCVRGRYVTLYSSPLAPRLTLLLWPMLQERAAGARARRWSRPPRSRDRRQG